MKTETSLKIKEPQDSENAYYVYMKTNRSIVDRLFAGQIQSLVKCSKCENPSNTFLPFLDISLEIVEHTL